jgi:hypothetical protein
MIELDAASHTGVDNMRDILENAQYMPTKNRYKIYLIDEVHMLSKSSFYALLKTLEEPPKHIKFLLATTDPQKVPITCPWSISIQVAHTPQGLELTPHSQLMDLAKILAMVVLPTPRVPVNKKPWCKLSASSALIKVLVVCI